MAASAVVGVDVIVKTGAGSDEVLGQRNAKLTVKSDKIDLSTKTDAWAKVFRSGWYEWSIACDGLLQAGGAGGIATLITDQIARTEFDVLIEIGSSGEQFTGTGFWVSIDADSPHDKEGTFSATIAGTGTLTPAVGA
jgi:predicted secreted protein